MLLQADVITHNNSPKTWSFCHYLSTLMSILNNVLDPVFYSDAFKCQKGCKITVKVLHTTWLDSLDSKFSEAIQYHLWLNQSGYSLIIFLVIGCCNKIESELIFRTSWSKKFMNHSNWFCDLDHPIHQKERLVLISDIVTSLLYSHRRAKEH